MGTGKDPILGSFVGTENHTAANVALEFDKAKRREDGRNISAPCPAN